MSVRAVVLAALLVVPCLWVRATTEVLYFFDTEDYTCDRSNDAIRDLANLLTEEGVRGNFNFVGYLALRLNEFGRRDVIAALRPHVIGTQTLYHSRHPDLAELADDPDYARAYRRTLSDEARALGMIEAVFGEGRCVFACPPGNSVTLPALDVYSDLGIVFNAATGLYHFDEPGRIAQSAWLVRPGTHVDGLWYFNQYHVPYQDFFNFETLLPKTGDAVPDFKPILDEMARYDLATFYMHPDKAVKVDHWDIPNYTNGNHVAWWQWITQPERPREETTEFYRRLRAFTRALKSDGRFRFSDLEAKGKTLSRRRALTRADLPTVRRALEGELTCLTTPDSWCVADVFQAVTRLLRGEAPLLPGKVYGFLKPPQGVTVPCTVKADDLRAAARDIDLATFLPAAIAVGGQTIGPADFLLAGLEVLTTGADAVRLTPREQLGSYKKVPALVQMNISGWIHGKDFKDAYSSDRLRLQLWTLRIEAHKTGEK